MGAALTYSCTCFAMLSLLSSRLAAPVQQRLVAHRLVLKPALASEVTLKISYNGQAISNGSELTPSSASNLPEVEFGGSETYTLMLIDPDAPSPEKPVNKDFVHWLVINIPNDAIESGQAVLAYMPPAPPPGTGYHHYIFKLYRQGQDTIQVKPFDSRAKFDPEHFANQYSLGGPLATLYFMAENQDDVEEASKTLTLP